MFGKTKKSIVRWAKSFEKLALSFERKIEASGKRSPFRKDAPLRETLSVVSPLYNVAPYLDQYLASLTSQSTGLKNVEIILIDDGSTDSTGEIAKRWARAFPEHIKYVHQENAGQAAARNAGLRLATGKWIIFPDPDDFLSRGFFAAINFELKRSHPQPLLMISLNLVFYMEAENKRRNSHPLKHRFRNLRSEFSAWDIGDNIQLSAATACFDREAIAHHGITFDQKVKPTFEDGHFVNRLLLAEPRRSVVFSRKGTYYYRKRSDASSTLDRSTSDPRWYTDQLRFGYLDLLEKAVAQYNHAPSFLQTTVLYDIFWRFRTLVGHEHRASKLSPSEVDEFIGLLTKIFSFIDAETISNQTIGGLTEEHKVALLGMFKGVSSSSPIIYLRQSDLKNGDIQFSHYSSIEQAVEAYVDGQPTPFSDISKRKLTFFGREYYTETRFWVKARPSSQISFLVDAVDAQIKVGPRRIGSGITPVDADRRLRPSAVWEYVRTSDARRLRNYAVSMDARNKYANCWLLMDRDDAADDNAEHLYRHLMKEGKADKAYFILRRDCIDWARLESEGFHLLEFGSRQHLAAVLNASLVISSHADDFILWPTQSNWLRDLATYQYVFLQHGVIHNDLSHWLNHKPIRMMVTSTRDEHAAITSIGGNYLFTEREVKLTGLPRHDALLRPSEDQNKIMIMPTWRRSLMGKTVGSGMAREKSASFTDSDFFRNWFELIHDPKLAEIADQQGKRLMYCPHPNLRPYTDDFMLPDYIYVRQHPFSYQAALKESAMLITDFSSIAFDAAFMNLPIIYYQFDKDDFYAEGHFFKPGYFDFEKHGFGPSCHTSDEVVRAVHGALSGEEQSIFSERRLSAFPYRDGQNCSRVLEEIKKLV